MFKILIDGEIIETVMYDDFGDVKRYALEEYGDENFSLIRVD